MSQASVIQDTSLTLKSLLEGRLNGGDPPRLGAPVTVTVDSPHRGNQDEFRLNLFLYNVLQDEGRRNSGGRVPLGRGPSAQRFAAEPLALRLYYLLTAFAGEGLTEHHLLGEAMQALYLHRRVPEGLLRGSLKSGPLRADHVEVNLLNLDVDALQKIWGSQTEFLRTSIVYEVSPIFIDADEAGREVQLVGYDKQGNEVDVNRVVDVVAFPYPQTLTPDAAPPGSVVRIHGAGLLLPRPPAGANLVRVLIGGVEAEQISEGSSQGALSVRVPPGLRPGPVDVQLRLDRYLSRALPFTVLPPP